jgi:hypothetical protein
MKRTKKPLPRKRTRSERAERLVKRLASLKNGHVALKAMERLEARLELKPMALILAKLQPKADSTAGRARLCGVTRQAYYDWLNEKTRPNKVQAERLAELTGFTVTEIRGRG